MIALSERPECSNGAGTFSVDHRSRINEKRPCSAGPRNMDQEMGRRNRGTGSTGPGQADRGGGSGGGPPEACGARDVSGEQRHGSTVAGVFGQLMRITPPLAPDLTSTSSTR